MHNSVNKENLCDVKFVPSLKSSPSLCSESCFEISDVHYDHWSDNLYTSKAFKDTVRCLSISSVSTLHARPLYELYARATRPRLLSRVLTDTQGTFPLCR